MKPSGIITLTTDFGLEDSYVAVMKGVILGIHPAARLVDITHQIQPGVILDGGRVLVEAVPFFPPGTIHLAVVDPGVGGPRRPILAICDGQAFVGPDNGLFWPILDGNPGSLVLHLNQSAFFRGHVSPTFHGRDIFAPVAAHLAAGTTPAAMGKEIDDPVQAAVPEPLRRPGIIEGQVVGVDRFGNLLTNIHRRFLQDLGRQADLCIQMAGLSLQGLKTTYSDVKPGEALALVGSSGFLEIAVNRGQAWEQVARERSAAAGTRVVVRQH